MADRKYVRLRPAKMGFEFLGVVPPKHQLILIAAFESVKNDLGKGYDSRFRAKEIFWINLWQDEDDIEDDSDIVEISDRKIAKTLDKWCRKAARKHCGRKAILDGYGFIANPKGSQQHQPWHIDYATDVEVLYIPLTPLTDKNAPQYITLPSGTPKDVLVEVAADVDEVDFDALTGEVDYVVVQQLLAKPMSILYMRRGTIHRGIPNTGEDDGVVFWVNVHYIKDYDKNYPYELDVPETGVVTFEKTR